METSETTVALSAPDADLATRLLEDVGYEKRLVGLKMAAMGGSNPSSLHSLREVANFIHVADYETALRDNHATVGYVEPQALSRWVSEVLGDEELSAAILQLALNGDNYGSIAGPLKALVAGRIDQATALLEPHDEDVLPPEVQLEG